MRRTRWMSAAMLLLLPAACASAASEPDDPTSAVAVSPSDPTVPTVPVAGALSDVVVANPLPFADPLWAISCDEAGDEARRRRARGELEVRRPDRDLDVDSVEISHQPVNDAVAAEGERPVVDVMDGMASISADELTDQRLVALVQLCSGAAR